MVKKVFTFISREIGGLHEAAYLLGFFAILSQILALARDRLLAHSFGAGHALDIYYAAFRIPDFIFVSIASIVSLSVLIPFLMERIEKGQREAKEFIDAVFTIFFFVMGSVAVLAFIFTPFLIRLFFPAFEADSDVLATMTRIMLLSPIFLGFSNFLASVTQIYKRFFIYALSPVVYNIGIIVGIVLLRPIMGMTGLAWGVSLGAFLHFFIQVPFVVRKALFPKIRFKVDMSAVKKVILVSLPRTLTLSSTELSKFFLISLASTIAVGAISVFNFAWNLQSVPLSIVGVSYSLAAFPMLTKLFTAGERDKFFQQMVITTKHIIFWSIPIMTMFVVLRAQIVRVILGSGNFNWSDTRLTAAGLALFTISLIPQSLILLFVRAYYARGDTKRPLFMNIASAGLIVASAFVLVTLFKNIHMFQYFIESLLRVEGVPGTVVLMLPLGFSLGVTMNALMLWYAFEHEFTGFTWALSRSLFQILSASIIAGFVSHQMLALFDDLFNINTLVGIFMQGFSSGIIGIIAGAALLIFMGNKELSAISATLHRKIWKAKVVPPDPSIQP